MGDYAAIDVPAWAWAALVGLIAALLLVDILLVHRKAHVISVKEAGIESAAWIAIAILFGLAVSWWMGARAGGEYFAGYLIEKSLSMDNVFVWAVIFSYFAVPPEYRFRVLFWGIFGALVMRAIFVFAGVALLETFSWMLYIFGAFLIYTAFKMGRGSGAEVHPDDNRVMRLVRRAVPSTTRYDGQKLFTVEDGTRLATPLFIVLVFIEVTDLVFAVDSVPAILAVSREPFIVFSSNAFAILGLRALFFLLESAAGKFRYLQTGLALILGFVGMKMILASVVHVPIAISLLVIGAILAWAIVASVLADRRDARPAATEEKRGAA